MMRPANRMIVLTLGAVAVLALPGPAVALSPPSPGPGHILRWSRLRPRSRVTCSRAVLRGSLTVSVYSLKGEHPSSVTRKCSRAEAVAAAGRAFLYSGGQRPLGRRFEVQGIIYTLQGIAGGHASDLTTAFVGAGTAVLAQLTSL